MKMRWILKQQLCFHQLFFGNLSLRAITLFDQTGADMDKACLATFLAESLFAPTVLLQASFTKTVLSTLQNFKLFNKK